MITSYGDQLPRTQPMKLHFKTGLVQRQRISFLMKRLPLHDRKELYCQENVVTQLEWFDVNIFLMEVQKLLAVLKENVAFNQKINEKIVSVCSKNIFFMR